MKKLPKIDVDALRLPEGMKRVIKLLAQGSGKVSVIGAAAGAGIDVVSATRDERGYLSELAKEYRPEIAERLGLAESQVTEQHYHMAFDENPVLAQAKQVSQMGKGIRAINSSIALGVGLLAGLGASVATRRAQSGGKQADAANIAGGVAATLGASGAGKIARKLLHTKNLDKALEDTAHHQIMEIKGKQQRGEETTAADVFIVQLALNPQLDEAIQQSSGGARFREMEPAQQQQLMQAEFPEILEANTRMARLINEEGLRPQQLVFGEVRAPEQPISPFDPVAPGHPSLPPNAMTEPAPAIEASGADEASKALLAELNKGEHILDEDKDVQPPQTPRSETPPEFAAPQPEKTEPRMAQEKDAPRAETPEKTGKDSERALQAMQEGRTNQPESFAGRLEAERTRQPEASPQR